MENNLGETCRADVSKELAKMEEDRFPKIAIVMSERREEGEYPI